MPRGRTKTSGSGDSTAFLLGLARANQGGSPVGLYSICSANRHVLEAGMRQAARDQTIVCIESTSNQVNQFGGYTGMTPSDFAGFVSTIAADADFPPLRIVLGGDHLGPHAWQGESADVAMAKARDLVRSCVLAGYVKIHLDTSMRCAGDPGSAQDPLADEIVTERAADLCRVAEKAHASMPPGSPAPVYVIGTEVPAPGGAHGHDAGLSVTKVEHVERNVGLAREMFSSAGLQSAWERVLAVVVQPGVEFGDASVSEYNRDQARSLSAYAGRKGSLLFEAHSTDYQRRECLRQMVEDHFFILKVGPWLTFAFREAVFALAQIEEEWLSGRSGIAVSRIRETLEKAMVDDESHWKRYYRGDEYDLRYARKFSFSDRSRYYWPHAGVQAALARLVSNLSKAAIPLPLLSQYLPVQYAAVREGRIRNEPMELVLDKIKEVLDIYAFACGLTSGNPA